MLTEIFYKKRKVPNFRTQKLFFVTEHDARAICVVNGAKRGFLHLGRHVSFV
jgi:hypothetical protein